MFSFNFLLVTSKNNNNNNKIISTSTYTYLSVVLFCPASKKNLLVIFLYIYIYIICLLGLVCELLEREGWRVRIYRRRKGTRLGRRWGFLWGLRCCWSWYSAWVASSPAATIGTSSDHFVSLFTLMPNPQPQTHPLNLHLLPRYPSSSSSLSHSI